MPATSAGMTSQKIALGISFVPMAGGWVYFVTNRRNGVLYTGVTSNLPRRAFEHREGLVEGFTKRRTENAGLCGTFR
jgi:GIY-YIG catalytic domain